jgi:hypothetical protein
MFNCTVRAVLALRSLCHQTLILSCLFYNEDGGSCFLRNAGKYLPDLHGVTHCKTVRTSRLMCSYIFRVKVVNGAVPAATSALRLGPTKARFSPRQQFSCLVHNWVTREKHRVIRVTSHGGPKGCETSRLPNFLGNRRRPAGRPAGLYPQEDSWYSFLIQAESTLGP